MPLRKEYTDKQYKEFLYTPLSSSYGTREDKVLNWFFARHPPIINNFGLTKANMKNTYLPYLTSHLGKGAYCIFLGYVVEEGATGSAGWINNRPRWGNAYQQLKQDVALIKSCLKNPRLFGLNQFAPETGFIPINATGKRIYHGLPKGSTGAMYMQLTLAGNACCWNSRAMNGGYYFGNPYDGIIDMIKQCGGKPFAGLNDGGGSDGHSSMGDQGSGINIKLPKKIYLNNSSFTFMGVHFIRQRSWLTIKYPFNLGTAATGKGSKSSKDIQGEDIKGNKKAVESAVLEARRIIAYNRKHRIYYLMVHPQYDPVRTGHADCSGFVCWCFRKAYPGLYNNGYGYTGSILSYGRIHRWVVYAGSQAGLIRKMSIVHTGDILVMGHDPNCGAGGTSHTCFCIGGSGPNATMGNMEANLMVKPLHYLLKNWWVSYPSPFPYMYVLRPR